MTPQAWNQLDYTIRDKFDGSNLTLYDDEIPALNDWLIPNVKDKVFFDVGCYIGIWSVVAVLAGAREIHLFEPSEAIEQAEKNVRDAGDVPVFKINKSINDEYTLDEYGGAPGFIKIDVEGAELKVLKGAQETIKRYHPIIMVENHGGPEREPDILKLLEGYTLDPVMKGNHANQWHLLLT